MAGPLQHFQMRMNNLNQSKAFYGYVFGWTFENKNSAGTWCEIKSGDESIGEIISAPDGQEAAIVSFFLVDDVGSAKIRAMEKLGTVEDPQISQSIQTDYAIINDIEGCTFGVYKT